MARMRIRSRRRSRLDASTDLRLIARRLHSLALEARSTTLSLTISPESTTSNCGEFDIKGWAKFREGAAYLSLRHVFFYYCFPFPLTCISFRDNDERQMERKGKVLKTAHGQRKIFFFESIELNEKLRNGRVID